MASSYFQKQNRPSKQRQCENPSPPTAGLSVGSNLFNKSHHKSPIIEKSQKIPQVSYLKNFRKDQSKSNQENVEYIPRGANEKSRSKLKNYSLMAEMLRSNQEHKRESVANKSRAGKAIKTEHTPQNYEQSGEYSGIPSESSLQGEKGPLQNLMQETDQSMEEILNSSINQFERFLEQENYGEHGESRVSTRQVYEHNSHLKKTLLKFKSILKEKLESGLNRQKQEMTSMLSEYVELITKLLHDKEGLSEHIERLELELKDLREAVQQKGLQVQELEAEKSEHIGNTKRQIDEFLAVIEQFEAESKAENERFQEMEAELERLRQVEEFYTRTQSNQSHAFQEFQEQERRMESQSEKIQTLLELLEKSQQETNNLKEQIARQNLEHHCKKEEGQESFGSREAELKQLYEEKIEQMELEHEEEFIEYEKAIKETLAKKDECIERLNFIIGEFREGKKGCVRKVNQSNSHCYETLEEHS